MKRFLFLTVALSSCLTWNEYEPLSTSQTPAQDGGVDNGMSGQWWNLDYPNRRLIEIPAGLTTETLTDIPVRVDLPFVGEVRFVSVDNTVFSHEKDESGFWVKIPSVGSDGTKFYVYSGVEDKPEAIDPRDVWSNGYIAVWHFDEELVDADAGFQPYFRDSVNGIALRQNDLFEFSFQEPGYFGDCLHLKDDPRADFSVPDLADVFPVSGELSFEVWHTIIVRPGTVRRIFGGGENSLAIEMRDAGIKVTARADSQRTLEWTPGNDVWAKMMVVIGDVDPRRDIKVYLDEDDALESFPIPIEWQRTSQNYGVGTPSTLDFRYDEMRFSNVARSASWAKFQAAVEKKPSPLIIGDEEMSP